MIRRVWDETPRPVWAISVLFVLLGIWWSILLPPGAAPDERTHVDLVVAVEETGSFPRYDERFVSSAAFWLNYPGRWGGSMSRQRGSLTPENASPRAGRPTIDELGGDKVATWQRQGAAEASPAQNQMPQHPPLYYVSAATTLRIGRALNGGKGPFSTEVMALRLLGVAFVAHVPLACYWAARRLGAGEAAGLTASVVPLLVPQVSHVSAAVAYTPLLIGLAACAAVVVAGVVRGDQRRRTAVMAGVLVGLCIWTSMLAVVLGGWLAVAYASLLRNRSRWPVKTTLMRGATALGVAGGIGGIWWLRNIILEGTPVPSSNTDLYVGLATDPDWQPRFTLILEIAARWLPNRFFGAFDIAHTTAQFRWPVVASLLVLAAVLAILALVPRRFGARDGVSTARVVVFGSVFVIALGLILARSWYIYSNSGKVGFLQGRYLFQAFVPFAVVLGIGLARVLRRFDRFAPILVLLLAGLTQLEGARAALDHWWAEPGASLRRALAGVSRWNPWFNALPHVLMAASLLVGVWVLVALVRGTRSEADELGAGGHEVTIDPS